MNEKMLEILNKIKEKRASAQDFLNKARESKDENEKKDFKAKARALTNDIKDLQDEFDIEKDLMESEKTNINPVNNVLSTNKKEKYENAFFNALKGRATREDISLLEEYSNALSSGTGEDGGFLIPDDQQVQINELKRQLGSLEELVNVEPVGTLTGSRVIEKDAAHTPFSSFTEGLDVPASDSPQFVTVSYTITDRGGILPIPNNLLNDNAANLKAYLNKWLAKKQVATRNSLIYTLLNAKAKTTLTADATILDDIKDIMNETLDPAIAAMSKVVTNQSGFNFLDKLKDADGNYILEKDPKNPTQKLLDGKPVKVYSNRALPNRNDGVNYQAPIIIGALEEAITLFDRQAMSLMSTNIGGDAFAKNRTDIRAITREDVKEVDANAYVFGEVVVGAV